MPIQAQSAASEAVRENRLCAQTDCEAWDIALRVTVDAEPLRVFHALTVSEYREAWMCAPQTDGGLSVMASQDQDTYCVDFIRAGLPCLAISGSYDRCCPSEILFSWCKRSGSPTPKTMVCIRLHGSNRGATVLNLRHSGFTSASESLWHQRFWISSLRRLVWLLERRHS
jgi:uncharacterized protein YndB with AHSA1/START domain